MSAVVRTMSPAPAASSATTGSYFGPPALRRRASGGPHLNDPVSLSDVPVAGQGRAAGLSATAEQFGSAFGIAVLCLAFTSATSPHFTPH
jgi:hypothetical protein